VPAIIRTLLKVAASIVIRLNASRQSSEFAAKATIAIAVRVKIRPGFIVPA
jgi:hypothetical protein